MNIITTLWPGASPSTQTVGDYVTDSLEEHGGGVAENAHDTARNTAKALGRLIELLAERHALTADEVVKIAGRYHSDATLIP